MGLIGETESIILDRDCIGTKKGEALSAKVIRPPVPDHLLDRFAIFDFVIENLTREDWKFSVIRKAERDNLSCGKLANTRLQVRWQQAYVTKLLLEANHAVLDR